VLTFILSALTLETDKLECLSTASLCSLAQYLQVEPVIIRWVSLPYLQVLDQLKTLYLIYFRCQWWIKFCNIDTWGPVL